MSKKSFFLIALSSLALFAVILFIGNINTAMGEDHLHAFYGITYVDGTAQSGVSVTLTIGNKHYTTTSYTINGQDGVYGIGGYQDTGWYCLQARYTTGQTQKGYGTWGTKSSPGSINQDLYLTGTWDSCPQHK